MRTALLWIASVALFLIAAKAHGRELRLEREAAGFFHIVFGGENPSFVDALWRAERIRFWTLAPLFALASALVLRRLGVPWNTVTLAALAWSPVVAFTACGIASLVRRGALDRAHLSGTLG